jgi:hypothetical protein
MNVDRFAMTPMPVPGGQPGGHEEAQAQWFLELAFFRDLVLRNPPGKGGRGELADAVVLHSDVALMSQVKAQSSTRPPQVWAKKAIAEALNQLGHTNRMLAEGHVTTLRSELLGELPVDPRRYVHRWGLIVLDQPVDPFDPAELAPEITEAPFPVQVYSLADLEMLTSRLDTAADFINYIEMRYAFRASLQARVHEEATTLAKAVAHTEDYHRHHYPNDPPEIIERSARMVRRTATGEFQRPPFLDYGRAYDDLIARLHDRDPDLAHNTGTTPADSLPLIEELSWLNRARRVALGQKIAALADHARDGKDHFFHHLQRKRGTVFVYLATSLPRAERSLFLQALTLRAQARYDCERAVGIATEPIGAGRSYDTVFHRGRLAPLLLERLRAEADPFGEATAQLTDSI